MQSTPPSKERSLANVVIPAMVMLCSASIIAAATYYTLAINSIVEFGEQAHWALFLVCYFGGLILGLLGLTLYNMRIWGTFFPKYLDGKTNLYASVSRTQAALLGIGLWGLPIALPWATKAAIGATPDDRLALFFISLATWCLAGVVFGLIMRGVHAAKPDKTILPD